jgi:hypothetical protein
MHSPKPGDQFSINHIVFPSIWRAEQSSFSSLILRDLDLLQSRGLVVSENEIHTKTASSLGYELNRGAT